MKKKNQSAMTLFLLVLLSLACGGGGGGGGLTGGDEAGDSDDAGDAGTTGTGTFEVDSPIDLPAPIAKGLDGIEPTSVQFTPISGQTGVAGTLTAETIGNVDATVAIIRSGEIYARKKTTGGKVEFEIPTELLGEVLALVVLAEDEESVSPAVLVQISQPTSSDEPIVDVFVTNTGVIQNQQIAVSSDGTVAFSALDSSSAPFIGIVSVNGGSPSVLNDSVENLIGSLRYRDNGDLWGIDTVTGNMLNPLFPNFVAVDNPGDAFFSFSPDDTQVLFTLTKNDGSLQVTMVNTDVLENSIGIAPIETTVTSLQYDWLTNDTAIIAKGFSDGTYHLETYTGLTQLSTNPSAGFTLTTLVTQSTRLANPQANRAEGDEFAYECGQASGTTGLCYYVMGINFSQTLDTGDVAHAREALDAAYVAYEKDTGSGLSNCAGTINLILDGSLTVNTIANGCYPTPHPTNSDLIAYLKPVDGKLQVGVINLENLGL